MATSRKSRRKETGKDAAEAHFEEQLAELEKLVEGLERGEMGLEEALEAFETGIQLTRRLMGRLDEAEKRIEVLLERAGGELEAREIDEEDLENAARRGGQVHGEGKKQAGED